MLPPNPLPEYILPEATFVERRTQWQESAASVNALTQLFENRSEEHDAPRWLGMVSFPLEQVLDMLSTVGGDQVRVHFLIKGGSTQDAFQVALSVAGKQSAGSEVRQQLSAYYASGPAVVKPPTSTSQASGPSSFQVTVPATLVNGWVDNWEGATGLETTMFQNEGQTLRGYTYPIKDFVHALLAPPADSSAAPDTVYFLFGLHQYYGLTDERAPVERKVFGLVLTVDSTLSPTARTYFDMSQPCPPLCGEGL